MHTRTFVENLFSNALKAACEDGTLHLAEIPAVGVERPRDESNGDWASTIAMRCAKAAKTNPRALAEIIVSHIEDSSNVASLEIAGPGFINVRLTPEAFHNVISDVRAAQQDYGKGSISKDEIGYSNVNLEYVSANPTGPMHVGHGRWAALGDATARIMRHAGYTVSEEFYVNDHGVQMDVFGTSISVRYQQLFGKEIEMPEACYGGSYVADIAQGIIDADGDKWLYVSEDERRITFREYGYKKMLNNMKETLAGFGTTFDTWFSERSLYETDEEGNTAVSKALDAFKAQGYVYEKDDATWFKSTALGDEKDRVLIKANGETTYFMSDCAYHYNKLQRGFDHLINIWGADHHGYIKRCEAMLEAWGQKGALEIMLGQLVNLFRDGEAVRMSKRTGEMVTFNELIDEVGVDATRYLMLSRSSDQQIDFDIEVAKKQDASNPVYYVQYAHARICSILRKAAKVEDIDASELAVDLHLDDANLSVLTHPAELALCSKMDDFVDLIAGAARDRAPFRLTHYAQEFASLFHKFYTECHVICEDMQLQQARLALCDAARIVLALTLSLLGVSAPQKM